MIDYRRYLLNISEHRLRRKEVGIIKESGRVWLEATTKSICLTSLYLVLKNQKLVICKELPLLGNRLFQMAASPNSFLIKKIISFNWIRAEEFPCPFTCKRKLIVSSFSCPHKIAGPLSGFIKAEKNVLTCYRYKGYQVIRTIKEIPALPWKIHWMQYVV